MTDFDTLLRTDDAARLPRVDFDLPRCPRCGDDRLRTTASRRAEDALGTWRVRYFTCLACGERFVARFS